MKMKKTQSLKLMLAGLLCSMGMSAWAADGDIFTDKKLVLQEKGGFAQVIAVASHDGTIVIPDEVKNDFDNDKVLKINKLAEGWWAGGQLVLKRDGGQEIAGSTVAKNLLDGGLFTLKLEATKLTSIAMQEIIPVNSKIQQFIVDPAAGLNMLPEHAFQKNKWIIDQAKTQANKTAWEVAVAKAEDALKGKDTEGCYIKGGLLGIQQAYTDGESYYVIGTEAAGTDFAGKTIYDLFLIDEDGTVAETASGLKGYVGASGDIKLNTEEGKINVASKVEGDVCVTVHTNSPAEAVAAAELAKEQADLKAEQAHKDAVNAEYAAQNPESNITPEKLARKAAAERLEAAILAFQQNKSWAALQKRVSSKTGTNVNAVDAWYAAFILANDPNNTLLALSKPQQWAPLTKEFIEAYEEFYGKEPRIVSKMEVQSYTFSSFGATGDIFHAGLATINPGASQITFTPWANGLVEDRSLYDSYDVNAEAQGYYQIKVLENSVDGFVGKYYYVKVAPADLDEENTYYVLYEKDDQGQIVPVGEPAASQVEYTGEVTGTGTVNDPYKLTVTNGTDEVFSAFIDNNPSTYKKLSNHYITLDGNEINVSEGVAVLVKTGPNEGAYIVNNDGKVYKMLGQSYAFTYDDSNDKNVYQGDVALLKSELEGYSMVAVVKIKKDEVMTVARILPVPTEIDAANPSNDIRNAIAAGTADQDALDEAFAKAKEAEKKANADAKQAAVDLKAAKKNLKDLQDALKKLQDDGYETAYKYEFGGDNTWLTNVQWDNDGIKDFGAYAFKDCVNANFKNNGTAGLFPSVTVNIGEEAFLNCKKLDADLKNTNATIANIGDAAFMNTVTTTVALENATKLKDATVGKNVWDKTPMKTINLLNTQLTQMPEGLAEDILRGEQAKDCNNKPIEGAYINTTLTSVVMPKGTTVVRDKNFWFCVNLSSITPIPVGITSIGDYAFAGTSLTEMDLTALDKLESVGDGAFAYNEQLTSVKFAEDAPFESLEGDIFRCDYSLEEIKLNDDVECLPAGLFADTQITKLDLSKTQVTVLPDLFWGNAEKVKDANSVCNTLTEIILPEKVMNATNDKVEIPGLQVIGNHAFAYLQGITEMTIPSSVWAMGTEVFAYDKNLKEVTAMDSRLTNLGEKTFRNCSKLEKFTFVTLNVINPAYVPINPEKQYEDACGNAVEIGGMFNFDDSQFFNCPKVPELVLTDESIDVIKGQFFKSFAQEYSKLTAYQPTITLTNNGTNYSATYFNENYGTWIPCDEADVYTAYQNVNEMIVYKAKRHNNYYKIPAANIKQVLLYPDYTEEGLQELIDSKTATDEQIAEYADKVGKLGLVDYSVASPSNYWYSRGGDQDNTCVYTAKDRPLDIAEGSPAVIIIAKKEKINVKRVSREGEKYQSTLDRDNELRIAGVTLYPDVTSNLCVWATDYESLHTFYILSDPAVVAEGKVVFPLSAYQGMGYSRLNVTIVDDELTGIMGVKDYIKNVKNSDAIYNLQGVRVSAPVKGQMYIQGGKKFIQK